MLPTQLQLSQLYRTEYNPGLVTQEQSWILTDLDAHTIDFDPFKYDYTNFTMFRSVDYSRPFVKHSLHR